MTGITTVTLAGDVLLLLPLPLVADAGGNVAVRGAGARHMYAATTSQMQQPAKLRGVRTMRPITGGHGGCGRQAALTPTPSWHRTGGRRAAWRARQCAQRLIGFLKERGLASLRARHASTCSQFCRRPPRVHGRRRYHMSQRAHALIQDYHHRNAVPLIHTHNTPLRLSCTFQSRTPPPPPPPAQSCKSPRGEMLPPRLLKKFLLLTCFAPLTCDVWSVTCDV